jgi:hypothetical protein
MSAHVNIRTLILAAAVAWLFAGSHTVAQAPPAGSDTDRRLKALEDKMDRILKLLDARPEPQAGTGATAAIEVARDKIKAELKAKEKELKDFLDKSPTGTTASANLNQVYEAISKYEAKRSEVNLTMHDMVGELGRVEKAYKDGGPENGNAAALRVITALGLGPKGLDENPAQAIVALLNREREKLLTTHGPNHPGVQNVDDAVALVRKIYAGRNTLDAGPYIKAMREEISAMASKIETLGKLIELEKRHARELNIYEVAEERIRRKIDSLRSALKVLDAILDTDETQRPK